MEEVGFSSSENFDIVPTHLAVQAMRDNGYKNAAYAIAELMDNAIQAGATHVELLCAERTSFVEQRSRTRVEQIAVLDNGCGMDADVLRMAMQFGNGTRLDADSQTGIGRFGMGLPASSVSQCTRVDVWTWQDGVDSALHTYLDLDEIKQRRQNSVPRPTPEPIPAVWRQVAGKWEQTGTLVVWSHLDRCVWRTSRAIFVNSEKLIGRIYRRFLDSGQVKIQFTSFNLDNLMPIPYGQALPNDPGYLMAHTSCPEPFDRTAMFQPWDGEDYARTFEVQGHPVRVVFSYAKDEARAKDQAGRQPWGQHAKENVGVSVVRAGRELELDQGLVLPGDPTERWWGVEIEFPPALDELFGVTNNKQSARHFADMAKMDADELLQGKSLAQLEDEYRDNGDSSYCLLEIVYTIHNRLQALRRGPLKNQTTGQRQNQKPEAGERPDAAETVATTRTRQRQEEGHVGRSDVDEELPTQQRQDRTEKTLRDMGLPAEMAKVMATNTVVNDLKYRFVEASLDTAEFFTVRASGGGALIITLNTQHPAYSRLIEVLEESASGLDADILRTRLRNAREGLRTLLIAWARYEDEQPFGARQEYARNARNDWGRVARDFLSDED